MVTVSDGHLGRTIAGRYRVEAVLGHGGMGDVFVARQTPLMRKVALKLIRAEYAKDPRLAARFEREARALAHLSDPHVVTLLDFGVTDEGELFMAMELLEGETLRTRLHRLGALETRAALGITQQVCRGLAAAHRAGVVHRDLKPENIMLTRVASGEGSTDFVKVLDLGVARVPTGAAHQTLTEQGKLVGTPGYMAPEMLLYGNLEEPRSDLYALGVMLFEMLTGEAPFSAATPIALVMKHAHEAPRHLDTVWPEVDQLVQQLLRKEPGERPPDALAVERRIAELLAGPHRETPRAVPQRVVDANAATTPKMQTPVLAAPPPKLTEPAAPRASEPARSAPSAPSAPPSRTWAGVAAAALIAAAVGGGAVFLWAQSEGPAKRDARGADTSTLAPAQVSAASAVEPSAAEPGVDDPSLAGPADAGLDPRKPARPRRPTKTDPPAAEAAKPRHVPDMSP
ncbi:MAG: serine/threonine protein kinase [Deltaproteobacteria bacterium]|nr:serine/threonine protein kinase [Deltaproteobacteria bacterium]